MATGGWPNPVAGVTVRRAVTASSAPSTARSSAAPAPSWVMRARDGVAASILGGAALGVMSWVTDQLGFPWSVLIPANFIGAWLAVAFVLGTTARTPVTGAARGLIGLLSAVAAYYLLIAAFDGGIRAVGASHAAAVWGAVAVVAGPLLGLAGGVWSHGAGVARAVAVAAFAAALVAEGVVFGGPRLLDGSDVLRDPRAFVLLLEVVLGVALPWAILRPSERRPSYLALVLLAGVASVAIDPLIAMLRAIADRF